MATISFEQWCIDNEIRETTVELLVKAELDSIKALRLLETDVIKDGKTLKGISTGQSLLLNSACTELRNASRPDPPVQTDTKTVDTHAKPATDTEQVDSEALKNMGLSYADIAELVKSTILNKPSTENATAAGDTPQTAPLTDGKVFNFDPFDIDKSEPANFYDIRDYVSAKPEEKMLSKDRQSFEVGDIKISLPDSKIKLDAIGPLQYMEASLRILRAMALKDNLSRPDMLRYVAYLIKIANFGQKFQWKSVLNYDREYRKSQAEMGFPWGADNSYMMQQHLTAKNTDTSLSNKAATKSNTASTHAQTRYDPETGKPICGRFNTQNGCSYGEKCSFVHKCKACFKHHSYVNHSDAQSAKPTPKATDTEKNVQKQ